MAQNKFSLGEIAGRNFKRLVEERGYTQEEFSDEFHVDVRTIRNWYKRIDNLKTIEEICSFFDVDLEDVFSDIKD